MFSPEDRQAVRRATAAAEARTAGEIVSYLVARADPYPEIPARAALLGALFSSLLAANLYLLRQPWGLAPTLWIALPPVAGAILGWLACRWPPLGRWLVGDAGLERRVRGRAEIAFLEEEVFKTRGRTGILIFIASWEHRAVILADEGIHRQVESQEWQQLADRLTAGIRDGRSAEALVEVIAACGQLLDERGVVKPPEDDNELDDGLRIRDE